MSERWRLVGVLSVAVVLAACGGGSTRVAAPSRTGSDATTVAIDLSVLTPSGTRDAGTATPVVGVVAAVTGACPDLSFVLSGVTIRLGARTRIEGGTCGDIKEGMRAGAIGASRADGSVEAAHVRIGPPPPAPVAGVIASLSGSCPALTFVLDGVIVRTSAATVFDGGTCSDLREGMRAAAIGPRAGDRTIEAEHVKFAVRPPEPQPPPSVSGAVRSVSGACPDLSFVIERTTVHASAKTTFEGGSCADVKVDAKAGATGTMRSDGSMDAGKVRLAAR